jgi:hypothetical protein
MYRGYSTLGMPWPGIFSRAAEGSKLNQAGTAAWSILDAPHSRF